MYEDYRAELDRAYGVFGSYDYFRRIKAELLRERLDGDVDPARILDVGAGDGTLMAMLGVGDEAICLDPDPAMAAQRVESARSCVFLQASGVHLPIRDAAMHAVVASCVFHHMSREDLDRCLRDMLRVLRPGGQLFVFEHNTYNLPVMLFLRHCVPIDRDATFIGSRELARRVAAAGFAEVRFRYFCFFPGFLGALRRLERYLGWLPLGGQFVLQARKPGT